MTMQEVADSTVQVSLLTGFLGSGKTTLIRRILRDPAFARTAVIVNEWGEVGLDHALIAASEESLLTLTTGCLCCAVRSDLAATLGCRLLEDGAVEVNDFGQTTRPGIYAIGDMARTATNPFAGHQVIIAAAGGTAAAIVIDQELLYND